MTAGFVAYCEEKPAVIDRRYSGKAILAAKPERGAKRIFVHADGRSKDLLHFVQVGSSHEMRGENDSEFPRVGEKRV